MNELNKFLKVAKDIIVDPGSDIENKIIDKIKNISEEDKKILDDGFREFLKKSNSKPYLFNKKLKENSGLLALIGILGITGAGIFLFLEYNSYKKQKAIREK
ncbi:hypothetical protein LLG07_04370 [bacterium]|nr:hypothetical protein [bacterium]